MREFFFFGSTPPHTPTHPLTHFLNSLRGSTFTISVPAPFVSDDLESWYVGGGSGACWCLVFVGAVVGVWCLLVLFFGLSFFGFSLIFHQHQHQH